MALYTSAITSGTGRVFIVDILIPVIMDKCFKIKCNLSNEDRKIVDIIYTHCKMCSRRHANIDILMWRVKTSILVSSNDGIDKARLSKLIEILGKDIMFAILRHSSLNLS